MNISKGITEISEISQFYVGKNIFVTGATGKCIFFFNVSSKVIQNLRTGFMGKVLVEKLLRDCEDLSMIYILVRTKKGVDPVQRHADYVKHMVFNKIREENPSQLKKIRVVKGDVSIDGLDLTQVDEQELINNVNLVFHCAANVRFDLTLKDAINFNTKGSYRMLQLAEKMKNLNVFTHVSTAYCQCNEDVLEERFYPANEDPYGVMAMVKLLKDDTLKMITPKLLNGLPNTYAFSKGLTEDLMHSFADKFPIVIARASVVTAAWKTPYVGWIEGLNGPTGMMIGAGKGVIRTIHCNPDNTSEAVPVDVTINAIIALAYKRSKMSGNICYFCNLTESGTNPMNWGETIETGKKLNYEYPQSQLLWYPGGSIKRNYYYHMICVIFFHYLPAYLIDFLMLILGHKPL